MGRAAKDLIDPTTQGELDRMLNRSHWSGKATALEDFAAYLQQEAGRLFCNNKDADANLCRNLAKECLVQSKEHRKKQAAFEK